MKVYYDLVFILNLGFDFLLLLTTSIILKRKTKIMRIFLGSLIGSLSIFFLFIKLNNLTLFLVKILISILMIITSFGFKDIKYFFNNFLYLYLVSIVLGGFLYLLNIEFSYHQEGLIFVKDGLSVNFLVLLLLSPTILIFYIYSSKKLKLNYNNYHDVIIYYKNQKYKFTGYLDTGNKLYDQYKKRPVILVDNHDNKFSFSYSEGILVSYETASNKSILKCLPADRVVVDDVVYENVLIGLLDKSFKIDGVDLILHSQLIGGTK